MDSAAYRARHARKYPAHPPVHEAFGRSIIVFVTLLAQARRPLFASPEVHDLLLSAWRAAHTWRVGRYVVMPDHIHLFCAPAHHDYPPLTRWVQYWKSLASRQWPRPDEQPVWQKSFWDTQVRSGEGYARKLDYVRRNPVRAGLCAEPEDWPFQGEMTVLTWHD
jgi:putative transposase